MLKSIILPWAPGEELQYGHTIGCILREIIYAKLLLGMNHLLMFDLSDSFYHIMICPSKKIKPVLTFPRNADSVYLVAITLVLPMVWNKSPPYFCAVTETMKDFSSV